MASYYLICSICVNSLYLPKTPMKLMLLIPLFTGEDIKAREVSWSPKNTWLGSGGQSHSQTRAFNHSPMAACWSYGRENGPQCLGGGQAEGSFPIF